MVAWIHRVAVEDVPMGKSGPEDLPLGKARDMVRQGHWDGVDCPCSGQTAKVHKRRVHGDMVRRHEAGWDWIEIKDLEVRGGDFTKLKGFEVVANPAEHLPNKRASGSGRPAQKGVAVARGALPIPRYAYLYDGRE